MKNHKFAKVAGVKVYLFKHGAHYCNSQKWGTQTLVDKVSVLRLVYIYEDIGTAKLSIQSQYDRRRDAVPKSENKVFIKTIHLQAIKICHLWNVYLACT